MRRKRKKTKAILFSTLVLILLTVVVSIRVSTLYVKNLQLEKDEMKLEQEIKEEEQKYIDLLKQKEYIKSDEYIEQLGREKFGLVKPDEIIFVNEEE
ncbi:septum formation initiator family protein [Vallitalea sp.]|uniref:septum formation initiator family protein n=1 Tax=Vallitalea sp. TaxID=1882829 RepID=UPI0025FA38BF|nr:septum formation initiator family protein [Vallitalea sp.]MCT4688069.1 septum formation initiator family protein [Vallitalea sp.]